jgi:hypothetical protein
MSNRISKMMSRTADSINKHWDSMSDVQQLELQRLVTEHLPAILVETAGDRLWTEMPTAYIRWMMVKSLAARMVYREGFEYLETMEDDDLAGLALRYLFLEQERTTLVDAVLDSDLQDKRRIASLLQDAGIFSTMGRRNTEL